jgi:hypothetical protein
LIEIADDGRARFTASGKGTHRILRIAANQQGPVTQSMVDLITAQLQQQTGGGRGRGKQE